MEDQRAVAVKKNGQVVPRSHVTKYCSRSIPFLSKAWLWLVMAWKCLFDIAFMVISYIGD